MRLRFAVLALLSSASIIAALPVSAVAHGPRHNHGVTIAVTPNPIDAGESVLIYGQLNAQRRGHQVIALYHRVSPSRGFTLIQTTRSLDNGFYVFRRADGVVTTNRGWFVRALGLPGNVHSRTVRERVSALVSLAASAAPTANGYDTNHRVVFTGHVFPNHAFERVALQVQTATSGDDWHTIKTGRLGPASNFAISYRFRVPDAYEVRAVFTGDRRNLRGESDSVPVTVQQTEVPDFLINTSAPLIDYGSSATISGVLDLAGTSTPDPGVSVTLWGHAADQPFHTIGLPTVTGTDGSYSFTVTPGSNTVYQVRTTFNPPATRHTARLFEGVRDVLSMQASSLISLVGGTVTFSGTVSPDRAGHVIYLQRLGADGDWHRVATSFVKADSTYSFGWTFGYPGGHAFRARIPGDPKNVAGASAPVTVTVAVPPVTSLPPGS
jgi:hypothetical protein